MMGGAADCTPTPTVNTGGSGGVSTSCAAAETNSVTSMLSGLPTAAAPVAGLVAVMVTLPVQVPATRPAVATDTVRVSFGGVTPLMVLLAPFNNSQAEPQVVVVRDAV